MQILRAFCTLYDKCLMTGIVGAAGGIGGYLLPNILGNLYQLTGSYKAGFQVLAVITILSTVLMLIIQGQWKKKWVVQNQNVSI